MTNSWLRATVFVSCWVRAVQAVLASEFNVTVDDADPSLHYYPPHAWYASGDPNHEPIPVDILEAHISSYHIPRLQRSSKAKNTKAPSQRTASSRTALQKIDGDASNPIELLKTVKASAPRADASTSREPLRLRSVSSKFTGIGVESVLQSDIQEAESSILFEFIGTSFMRCCFYPLNLQQVPPSTSTDLPVLPLGRQIPHTMSHSPSMACHTQGHQCHQQCLGPTG